MDNTALEIKQDVAMITEQDIKKYIAPTATDKEVYMFLNIAKSYGLNPFKREIHFVKYGNNPGQVIVGYETYLKRAEETGLLDGWKAWVDEGKAKVIIYRKDRKYPFEWEIDIEEFDKKQALWKTLRNFMAKKVCIAQAFRLCFPSEMGGLPYIPEEMGVDEPNKPEIPSRTQEKATRKPSEPRSQETNPPVPVDEKEEEITPDSPYDRKHIEGSIRTMVKEMYGDKDAMTAYMIEKQGGTMTLLKDLSTDALGILYDDIKADFNKPKEVK